MIDGNGGMNQATPPSFSPSSGRRRGSTQSSTSDARSSQAQPQARQSMPSDSVTVPPSFSPATPRVRSVNDAAHQSSSVSTAASAPQTPHVPASGTPRSYAPRSYEPQSRQPRRSSGSTQSTAPTPAAYHARPAMTTPSNARFATASRIEPAKSGAHFQSSASTAVARSPRPGRVRHVVLVTLAVLVALLIFGVFGAWNWANGKIGRASWLTNMADSSGASSWLLVGSDKRDNTEGVAGADDPTVTGFRTDTLLVLTKPKNGPSSLISIPRDSLVTVDGQYMKINSVAQVYGNQALVGQIEQITGQKIDHVAEIQFGGLKNMVDAIGGVNLCYDQTVDDLYSGLKWTAGCHDADGTTALAFSRMRYSDAQGDFGRAARQRQVIAAVMKKALSPSTVFNPAKVAKLADASLSAVTVDEDTNPMTLASMAFAFRDATGDGGVTGSLYWSNPDYYVDGVGSSVLLDDAANTKLFSQLAAGSHASGEVGTLAEQ